MSKLLGRLWKPVFCKDLNTLQVIAVCFAALFCLAVFGEVRNGLEENLYSAARNGDIETVKRLVSLGVDIDGKTTEFYPINALHAAIATGNTEIVRFLLEHHADTRGALREAIEEGHEAHPEIIRLLKAAGATEDDPPKHL